MQSKPERAAILDVLCEDLLSWESRITALSARTNDNVELESHESMGKVLEALRSHCEVLVVYLRDKPSNVREVILKTSGRA